MCKIAICDDDKEYREKIKTVIKTEGILSSNEIRFYEYESGKELLEDADILHDLIFMDMRMPGLDGNTYDFIKSEIVLWRFFRDSYIGGKDNAHPYGRHFIYLSGEKGLYDIHCQTGKDRRDALQGIFK